MQSSPDVRRSYFGTTTDALASRYLPLPLYYRKWRKLGGLEGHGFLFLSTRWTRLVGLHSLCWVMPGKLRSDADLESDVAVAKVEMPRKQNEKVPLRAEGLGTRQDERPGRGTRRAARTRPGRRPAWVSTSGFWEWSVLSMGGVRVAEKSGQMWTSEPAGVPRGPRVWTSGTRSPLGPTFWSRLGPPGVRVRGGNCKSKEGPALPPEVAQSVATHLAHVGSVRRDIFDPSGGNTVFRKAAFVG